LHAVSLGEAPTIARWDEPNFERKDTTSLALLSTRTAKPCR
jgi:hypothetical protein